MAAPVSAGTRSNSVPLLQQEVAKLKSQILKSDEESSRKWKEQQAVNLSYLRAIAKLQKAIHPLVPERAPKRRAGQQQRAPAVFEEPQGGGRRKRAKESLSPIQVDNDPIQPRKLLNRAGEPPTAREILASTGTGLTEDMAQMNVQGAPVQAAVVQAPVVQAPVVQAPVVQAPVVQAPVVQAPVRRTRQHPFRRSGRR